MHRLTEDPENEGIVLIIAPTGRDTEGACMLLDKAGIACLACKTFQNFHEAIGENVGVIILAEEALRQHTLQMLIERLEQQPVWSDIPIIMLRHSTSINKSSTRNSSAYLAEVLSNVMFLERPLHALTLVSAVRAALKARRRQYQIRDYLIERERITEELRESQQKLLQSNRELEQFATIASHDLQAPLRKVQIFGDMLQQATQGKLSAEGNDYIDRMQKAIQRMQLLISDLLNLSRVTRQGKPFQEVDLRNVLHAAIDDLGVYRREVNGQIYINDIDINFVFGDPSQIQQVLQNLIENGLKFHREGLSPIIRISAKEVGDYCRITIEDNGIGISNEHTERIFETFQRLHGQSEYPGTGIGLSIVHKIVERHNGNIKVVSKPGEGCQFILDLPLSQSPAKVPDMQRV